MKQENASEQFSQLSHEATANNKNKLLLKQIVSFSLALLCLWLAFRNADWKLLLSYMQELNLTFVALVFISSLLSHFFRAWRWLILLAPLSSHKIKLWNSFCAVMYGYAVNVAIPRGGEIVRLMSISKKENLPWAGVLPTMFIDRVLDLVMLAILLGICLTQLPKDVSAKMPYLAGSGITMMVISLLVLILLPVMGKIIKTAMTLPIVIKVLPEKVQEILLKLCEQFDQGTKSLTNILNYPAISILTVLIWLCYWLNIYLMICAFGMTTSVSVQQSLLVFTIGSVGVLIPTPGSVGSYHLLISQALSLIAHIENNQALAYAFVLHLFCFVIATCIPAGICFLLQNSQSNNQNKKDVSS
jgi:uncharacterized protein (TIRG00374 family)